MNMSPERRPARRRHRASSVQARPDRRHLELCDQGLQVVGPNATAAEVLVLVDPSIPANEVADQIAALADWMRRRPRASPLTIADLAAGTARRSRVRYTSSSSL